MPYTVTFTSAAFVEGSLRAIGDTHSVDDNTARMLVDLGVATTPSLIPNTQITTVTAPFASDAELMALTGTTQVLSPRGFGLASISTNVWSPSVVDLTAGTSGLGANANSSVTALNGRMQSPNVGVAGYATKGFTLHFPTNAAAAGYNFGKESGHSMRLYSSSLSGTFSNIIIRSVLGRMGGGLPVPATLAARGYGWEWNWGTRVMSIIAHDGTTLTTTPLTTPFNPLGYRTYDLKVLSNGLGTISMYIDGVLVGTSSGGPATMSGVSNLWWQTEIQSMSTAVASQVDMIYSNPKVYTVNG